MSVAIVTHNATIYRTRMLTSHLERLQVPYHVVIPSRAAIIYQDGKPRLFQNGKEFWPTVALNALFAASGQGLEFIESLEAAGVDVVNSAAAWRRAKSKPLTTAFLRAAGFPQPDTYVAYRGRVVARALPRRSKTLFVSKPWTGSLGKGITRARASTYRRILRRKRRALRSTYLQRFIRNPGRDIRVVVVDGRAIGATYRVAPRGKWKTNVASGGKPVYCRVGRELAEVAVGATRALGLDLAGVDIIEGPQGLCVLELNAWPEYEVFDRVARVDVAGVIAQYLAQRWRARSPAAR